MRQLSDRLICIGDVHGCYEELMELLWLLKWDAISDKGARICFCGDLMDKGPNEGLVLTEIGYGHFLEQMHLVLGNHDSRVLGEEAYWGPVRPRLVEQFIVPGHKEPTTVVHSGICAESLPLVQEAASIDAYSILADKSRSRSQKWAFERLMYTRHVDANGDWTVKDQGNFKVDVVGGQSWQDWYSGQVGFVVAGHSPSREPVVTAHSASIDTGCVHGGKLTAMVFHTNGTTEFVSTPAKKCYFPTHFEW